MPQQQRKRVVTKRYSAFGCSSCRNRKIKCDECRPICNQCLIARRNCHYDSRQIDIDETENAEPDNSIKHVQYGPVAPHFREKHQVAMGFHRNRGHGVTNTPHALMSGKGKVSVPWGICNWHHSQLQLRNAFIEECGPNANRMEGCFTSVLLMTDVSPKPLSSSTVALGLVHAASKQQPTDRRLVYEADKAFGLALAHLRHGLVVASQQKRTGGHNAHTILLGMLLIGLYGEPVDISQPYRSMQRNWEQHLDAAARYMKAIKTSAFDMSKESEASVIHSALYMSFKLSLSFRRAMVLEADTSRFLCAELAETLKVPLGLFDWHRIVFPLPGLLEQADSATQEVLEHEDWKCASLVRRLVQIRRDLQLFFRTSLCPLIVLENPARLDPTIEEHMFILDSSLFHLQYQFPSLLVGVTCIMTWLSCLIADCAALRLVYRQIELRGVPNRIASNLERAASETAVQLCRSIHFLSGRESLPYAQTTNMVLLVVGTFFAEVDASRESNWCQGCWHASQKRLGRLSMSEARPLCRVADVTSALVAAARFRSLKVFCAEKLIV